MIGRVPPDFFINVFLCSWTKNWLNSLKLMSGSDKSCTTVTDRLRLKHLWIRRLWQTLTLSAVKLLDLGHLQGDPPKKRQNLFLTELSPENLHPFGDLRNLHKLDTLVEPSSKSKLPTSCLGLHQVPIIVIVNETNERASYLDLTVCLFLFILIAFVKVIDT